MIVSAGDGEEHAGDEEHVRMTTKTKNMQMTTKAENIRMMAETKNVQMAMKAKPQHCTY